MEVAIYFPILLFPGCGGGCQYTFPPTHGVMGKVGGKVVKGIGQFLPIAPLVSFDAPNGCNSSSLKHDLVFEIFTVCNAKLPLSNVCQTNITPLNFVMDRRYFHN
jgi:hypothetical protein